MSGSISQRLSERWILTGLSGQLCGRMLGDLGMEVIKIEPPGGDPVRNLPPFVQSADGKRAEHDVCPSERGQSEQGARAGQRIGPRGVSQVGRNGRRGARKFSARRVGFEEFGLQRSERRSIPAS